MPVKEFFKFNMDTLTLVTKISGSLLKKRKEFWWFWRRKRKTAENSGFDLITGLWPLLCSRLQLLTYVKIFIESWKSPLLNFPMVFRVKRAKKFVKRVWVVVEGKNMKEIPSLHVKILLSNVIKMREICMLWGLASKWQTSQDFPTFKNNV